MHIYTCVYERAYVCARVPLSSRVRHYLNTIQEFIYNIYIYIYYIYIHLFYFNLF